MEVYRRHFRVIKGPLIKAVESAKTLNDLAHKEYEDILSEIGAEPGYYHRNFELVSIVFKDAPDTKIYKRKDSGWYPKKNSKAGKQLAARIESVETKNLQDCLEVVGLSSSFSLFYGGYCHHSTLTVIPEKAPVLYVSVPWYDEDPSKVEQYKIDNGKGVMSDMNLDSILWEPTPDMEEVKGWEVDKHIEEWNDRVKATV